LCVSVSIKVVVDALCVVSMESEGQKVCTQFLLFCGYKPKSKLEAHWLEYLEYSHFSQGRGWTNEVQRAE